MCCENRWKRSPELTKNKNNAEVRLSAKYYFTCNFHSFYTFKSRKTITKSKFMSKNVWLTKFVISSYEWLKVYKVFVSFSTTRIPKCLFSIYSLLKNLPSCFLVYSTVDCGFPKNPTFWVNLILFYDMHTCLLLFLPFFLHFYDIDRYSIIFLLNCSKILILTNKQQRNLILE